MLNFRRQRAAICLLAFLLAHPTLPTFSAESAKNSPFISIEAEDETFMSVFEKIASVTGYQFLIAEELVNIPITIKLRNETLEGALMWLLRGLNYAIIWDETEKKISISIYGQGVTKWTPIPAQDIDLSVSGRKTKFDQATSTIAE
jgi:hypothetical protein